jgi:hypothetical protein
MVGGIAIMLRHSLEMVRVEWNGPCEIGSDFCTIYLILLPN